MYKKSLHTNKANSCLEILNFRNLLAVYLSKRLKNVIIKKLMNLQMGVILNY